MWGLRGHSLRGTSGLGDNLVNYFAHFQSAPHTIIAINCFLPMRLIVAIGAQCFKVFISIIFSVFVAMVDSQMVRIFIPTFFAAQLSYALNRKDESSDSIVPTSSNEATECRTSNRTVNGIWIDEAEFSTQFARAFDRYSRQSTRKFVRSCSEAFATAKLWVFLILSMPLLQECGSAPFADAFNSFRHGSRMTCCRAEFWRLGSSKAPCEFISAGLAGMNWIRVVAQLSFGFIPAFGGAKPKSFIFTASSEKDIPASFAGMFRPPHLLTFLETFRRTETRLPDTVISCLASTAAPFAGVGLLSSLHFIGGII